MANEELHSAAMLAMRAVYDKALADAQEITDQMLGASRSEGYTAGKNDGFALGTQSRNAEVDDLHTQVGVLTTEKANLQGQVSSITAENVTLRQKITELEGGGNPTPTPTPPPVTGARFPGDPGVGKYRVGFSLGPGNADITAAKKNAAWNDKISVVHAYAGSSVQLVDRKQAQAIIDAGIPVVSMSLWMKAVPGASNADKFDYVLAGKLNSVIDSDADWCKSKSVAFWLTLGHEPEDNITSSADQAKFRAVTRYVVKRFQARGANNVAWQPIYMDPYTFDAALGDGKGSERDFRWWHADWKGTSSADPKQDWYTGADRTMTLLGLDLYNPLPAASGPNRGYVDMAGGAIAIANKRGLESSPRTHPEFGMGRANPTPDWVAWAKTARDYAGAHDVVSFQYWDNSADTGRYTLTGTKLDAWNLLVAGAVAR